MKCASCSENAVLKKDGKYVCKDHFLEEFESTITKTVKDFKLLKEDDKILVACSGGKDSITVLDNIKGKFKDVTVLVIDEGIADYRDETIVSLEKFCKDNDVKLIIKSFKEEFGIDLDGIMKKTEGKLKPCTVCGTLRRFLLNKHSRDYDKLITGHNMDDELQSFLMNLLKGNPWISARLGPTTGIIQDKKFTPRAKPLYFCSEKEIRLYAFLKGYDVSFNECPYAVEAYRFFLAQRLNELESEKPGSKKKMLDNSLKILPHLKRFYKNEKPKEDKLKYCTRCSEPSRGEICNTCKILEKVGIRL